METSLTSQQIKIDLIKLKNNLKFANHFEVICEAKNNKEYFKFTSLSGDDKYLLADNIYNYGRLNLNLNDVKHFEDMYKICFDKKITNKDWLSVISSIKYVIKNLNLDGNDTLAYNITKELLTDLG